MYQPVSVEFETGRALIQIQDIFQRQVVPLPTVYVVNPSGSQIYEKAHLVIEGAGFDSNAIVMIDGEVCPVISANYEQVVCGVPNLNTGSWAGSVMIYSAF